LISADGIARARAARIEDEIMHRGIELRGTVERSGPCPRCGGIDRFAINTRKQLFNCRRCGKGGDVIALKMFLDGVSFSQAVETLSGKSVERPLACDRRVANRNKAIASRIWAEAEHPSGTIAATYLVRRGLVLPEEAAGEAIRFHPACPFKGSSVPCMVALVRDVITNEPKAIHRTALTADGNKAAIDGVSRLSLGPVGGGAVKLTPDEHVTLQLGIGEGIESTLSAQLASEFGSSPVWALLSAGQVSVFPVLAGIEALWVAVDPDQTGIKAARVCADRWQTAGVEVFLLQPRAVGVDLNDLARA
jgi:putative DNA primase/helicase